MTQANPIPPQLSHLIQRDAAVRARVLEEAAQIADRFTCGGCGMDGKTGIAIRAMMQVPKEITVVRRDIPTPPAPAPDEAKWHYCGVPLPGRIEAAPNEAAIRAELVAALRVMVYETTHLSRREDDGSHWCKISSDALHKARAALAKAAT